MNYISLLNRGVTLSIDCMQYDTSRYAEFMIAENVQDKNCTYELETKNDKEVKGDCTISDDNVVSFLIPENVTASPGTYDGQLIIKNSASSSDRLGSFPFQIKVTEALHQQDDPYEVALSEVRQATQECIDATEDLNNIKSAAQTATSSANSAASSANAAASKANTAVSTANAKIEEMQEVINRFGDINPKDLVTPSELNSLKTELMNLINGIKNGTTDVMVEVEGS